ncbi:hypothetical protein LFYK43_16130 [Ligilactobacillus salitolerans]|uniref:DUF4097 domain-containing protein n=1 Tax=Ligilactobacillus salitolerans TaxID=1808352 RepID=A0A401IUF0_9LACO|nr:DUF4097 family beta strand repeat-containing protein [Ligilactobacillus salitolerans]GBG95154.1 hypothetical protein LFYK43_16130 [Ligilactobacillus salitolerans]
MKKMLLWTIGIVVVVLLIAGGFAVFLMQTGRRFDFNTQKMQDLTTQEIAIKDTTQSIDLNLRTAKINVQAGKHALLKIKDAGKNELEVTQNTKTLSLSQANALKHHLEIGKTPEITLTVPANQLSKISGELLNGTVKIQDLRLQSLQLHHHNGTTRIKNTRLAQNSTLTKDNGATDLDGLAVPGLNITVKTGQITVHDKKLGGKKEFVSGQRPRFNIRSGSGQVKIN